MSMKKKKTKSCSSFASFFDITLCWFCYLACVCFASQLSSEWLFWLLRTCLRHFQCCRIAFLSLLPTLKFSYWPFRRHMQLAFLWGVAQNSQWLLQPCRTELYCLFGQLNNLFGKNRNEKPIESTFSQARAMLPYLCSSQFVFQFAFRAC